MREVLIKIDVAEQIQQCIAHQQVPGSEILFTDRYGQKISRNGIARALGEIAGCVYAFLTSEQQIHLTPHLLRHSHG